MSQAIEVGGRSRVDYVVVVAAAVSAPVHAADDCFAVGDQELHVVDLMGGVIHGIEELWHPLTIELGGGGAACLHGRVGDHAYVDTPMAGVDHLRYHVGPIDLIPLVPHARPRGAG